jgi:hypothetical protein
MVLGLKTYAPEETLRSAFVYPHEQVHAVCIFSLLVYVSALVSLSSFKNKRKGFRSGPLR